MENSANIESVRALLAQGETGKAIEQFVPLLEKDERFKGNLLRILRVAEANFNAVRQQELKGILSFQEVQREYSKVNDTLLNILDDFEAGRVPMSAAAQGGHRRQRLMMVLGGGVLLSVVAFLFLQKNNSDCPKFEEAQALHVIIFPFEKLAGPDVRPEPRIRDDIQELTKKGGFPAEARIGNADDPNGVSSQDAERRARACAADLVIFGQYQAFEKDSVRVRMGFKFLKKGGATFNAPFETFRDVTAVQPARDLKDAVFSLCAMIAIENKNWEFAKRWMGRIKEKDEQEMKMAAWLDEQGQ